MTRAMHRCVRGERGVALLSALFAVALLTIIVIEMTDATLVHTHLTRNAGNAMAAQLLARSAELAGEALISNDDTNPSVTCRQNPWALPLFGIPAGEGVVGLQVSDEGGKLDLNSVRDERYGNAVKSLFSSLDLDPSLVDRIGSWITPENDPSMATGGGSDYCALAMSCTPRHKPLYSLEELLLLRGFDEQVLLRLRPYATVVPPATDGKAGTAKAVNPLTADPLVLAAIGCERGTPPPDCPSSFANDEKQKEWQKEFDDWKTENCTPDAQRMLKTQSNLYSILASGTVGDVTQYVRATVQRNGDKTTRRWWQEHARPGIDATPVEVR